MCHHALNRVIVTPFYPMKKIVLTTALLTAVGAPQADASEPFCFMKAEGGQVIDLTSLCGSTPVVAASHSISTPEVIPFRAINRLKSAPTPSLQTLRQSRLSTTARPWERAAQQVASMRPYWSGYCHRGNQPCHTFSKGSYSQATQHTIGSSSVGRCIAPDNRATDGSRCGGRSSQSRPGGQ